MDDDIVGSFVIVIACLLAILGAFSLPLWIDGSLDKTIVFACEKQGYWQTGQTRIICSVEKK
jgi:hypothetical protein